MRILPNIGVNLDDARSSSAQSFWSNGVLVTTAVLIALPCGWTRIRAAKDILQFRSSFFHKS